MRSRPKISHLLVISAAFSMALFGLANVANAATKKKVVRYTTVSAIPGKDEKNFTDPTTRCLTPAMKSLHASTVSQMEKDITAAEKRGKKFDPPTGAVTTAASATPAAPSATLTASVCSTSNPPQVCLLGQAVAGQRYTLSFSGFAGQATDWISIAPKYNGISSPSIAVQSDMTHGNASGTVSFDGLPAADYTAYAYTNLTSTGRATTPAGSVDFTVLPPTASNLALLKSQGAASASASVTVSASAPKDAAEIYREKVSTVWAAMAQPYCGYGAYGITAVKKSYNKSVARIRADFLAATK